MSWTARAMLVRRSRLPAGVTGGSEMGCPELFPLCELLDGTRVAKQQGD